MLVAQGKSHAGGAGFQLLLQGGIGGDGAFQAAADDPQCGGNSSGFRGEQQGYRFALPHGLPQGGKQLGGFRAADSVGKFRRKGGGFLFEILVGGIEGGLVLRFAAYGKNGDLHGTVFSLLWIDTIR